MRMTTMWAAVAVVVSALTGAVAAPQPVSAEPLWTNYVKPAAGPRGAITVIGDSVMLGSVLETDGYGPSLPQMLVERGWGPVRAVAGVGFQAGLNVQSNAGADMSKWVLSRRAEGWDSPVYVIGIGPNDVLGCSSRQACSEQDILGLVDTIGLDHEIWWSMITMTNQRDADVWNAALTAVAAVRPNLHVWNWPVAQQASGIPLAGDRIHLPTGAAYRARSRLMADDVTTRLGVSNAVGIPEAPPSPLGAPSEYQPLPLRRVYDSRVVAPTPAPALLELDLTPYVPAGTTAVSMNLTAVAPAAPSPGGYLTAYPCGGARPPTSNVNFSGGQIRPNHVVVALGSGNRLCVFASTPTDVIVDLQGAFVPSGALRLTPLEPTRLVDTRTTGRADPLVVTVPSGVAGVVLNATVVGAAGPGFLVVYPCDAPSVPATSNLNFVAGDAVAGSVYVQTSASGTICARSSQPADVIIDLQGTFAATGLRFQAATPKRMLDTRIGTGGWRGQVGVGQSIGVAVAPAGAQAVTGNITMVQPGLDGFAVAFPCGGAVPSTSSVNAAAGTIAANSLTAASGSDVCVRSSVGAHLVFDTTGWWAP